MRFVQYSGRTIEKMKLKKLKLISVIGEGTCKGFSELTNATKTVDCLVIFLNYTNKVINYLKNPPEQEMMEQRQRNS